MQIYELTRQQLNEVDIAGPGGLLSKIGAAGRALMQPGGAKDALRTITPGAGQGAFGTHDLTMSDFAKRMQAVKNTAAMKQVAANLQAQWKQASKSLPAAQTPSTTTTQTSTTSASGYKSVATNAPTTIPNPLGSKFPQPTVAKQSSASSTAPQLSKPAASEPVVIGKGQKPLDPKNPADAALIAKIQAAEKKLPITEAASLGQLTDWYKKSVIPQSMAAHSATYLANPAIKNALAEILATESNPDDQEKAFQDLVAATSVESQQITASTPQAAASSGGAAGPARRSSPGASAAATEISKAAGISTTQLEAIKKITSALGPVRSADAATTAYLQALGFTVS